MQPRLISMTLLLLFGIFGVTTAQATDLKAEEQRIRDRDTKWAAAAAVTLRFADAVGEILTARPEFDLPPLPSRHYI